MPENQPHRISLAAATAIVVSCMVGTGVFTSLGFQIADIPSGCPIMVLWIIGGIVSLCGAFCYAELVAMMPRSGGEYHLLERAYHPLVGFIAGWVSITAGFAGPIAVASMAFGSYMKALWPVTSEQNFALALALIIAVMHMCRLRTVERFQTVLTVVKVLLILVFIIGAWFMARADRSLLLPKQGDAALYGKRSYAVALVYVMYAYSGWNGGAYVTGEVRDPRRNVPLALMLGTLMVMVLYVALNGTFLVSASWADMKLKPQVGLVAARGIFGEGGGNFMGALISFGLVAHVSAMLWSATRMMRVIGEDAALFRWMDRSNRHGAPWLSVLFISALIVLLLLKATFIELLNYIQGLLLLSSLMAVTAVIWLRIRQPEAPRPFKVPLYPLTPLVFIAVTVWMLYALVAEKPRESSWGAVTLLIGAALYFVSKVKRKADV